MKQALQRARYSEHLAQLGRLAVDARDPQVLLEQVPAIAAAARSASTWPMVYLLETRPARAARRQRRRLCSPASGRATLVANRPDTSLGFVLAQGRSIIVADYRRETRFAVPRPISTPA